jgi:hypothetical protein
MYCIRHSASRKTEAGSSKLQVKMKQEANMEVRLRHSWSMLFVLVALLTPCRGQTPPPKPMSIYVLDVSTNIKGDFSAVAPELTQVLQTAFSQKHDAFKILERSHLDQLVRANQLESDLDSILQGKTVSAHFVQLIHADGFISSELVDGPDGVVLTVTLESQNSEILSQGQAIESRAMWLLHKVQVRDATKLADEITVQYQLSAGNQRAIPQSQGSLSTPVQVAHCNSATFTGTVDTGTPPTHARFAYATDKETVANGGGLTTAVRFFHEEGTFHILQFVPGLSESTTYYYRLEVTNNFGTIELNIVSFTTPACKGDFPL